MRVLPDPVGADADGGRVVDVVPGTVVVVEVVDVDGAVVVVTTPGGR
ncbi:MAG: hypothetical protein KDB37_04865 [Ilumatobacter sp.]|nr:hypothetical protein [Ilumatobacter sp.]